jgi:hypothetical protein
MTLLSNIMLMACGCCCFMLLFAMLHAVELSVCIGVAGWGYPNSWSVVCKMFFGQNAPISTSDTDDNTGFIIVMDAKVVLINAFWAVSVAAFS